MRSRPVCLFHTVSAVFLMTVLTGPAKGATLFVSEPGLNQVSAYDLATGTFVDSYSVSRPTDVAIGPDGNLVRS